MKIHRCDYCSCNRPSTVFVEVLRKKYNKWMCGLCMRTRLHGDGRLAVVRKGDAIKVFFYFEEPAFFDQCVREKLLQQALTKLKFVVLDAKDDWVSIEYEEPIFARLRGTHNRIHEDLLWTLKKGLENIFV